MADGEGRREVDIIIIIVVVIDIVIAIIDYKSVSFRYPADSFTPVRIVFCSHWL